MPKKQASTTTAEAKSTTGRQRRPAGEPRRLLIEAARNLFDRKGYASTSTREIADLAEVSETLMFRYFGSKAGLFREAMVKPFVELVDNYIEERSSNPDRYDQPRQEARKLLGDMYDLFLSHRALAALLFAADALTEGELAESGILDEVRSAIERLVAFGSEEARAQGAAVPSSVHDLTTRATIAMVAGMATLGTWYYGKRRPSRDAILDELTEIVMSRYLPSTADAEPTKAPAKKTRARK
jgi:AcrR family transcriptional regulator